MLKLSIIITTCDRPSFLKRSLTSIFSAGFDERRHEIWVIDDSDSDLSFPEAKKFEGVNYIAKSMGKGVSLSRNLGIKVATAEYLLFLDDDDFLCDGSLDIFGQSLASSHDFYFGNYYYIYDRYRRMVELSGISYDHLLVQNRFPMGSFIIRKESIREGFDCSIRTHEDWLFLLSNVLWNRARHINHAVVCIDKTTRVKPTHLQEYKKFFVSDFKRIYDKFPATHLTCERELTLDRLRRV